MQRFGMVVGLRPQKRVEYLELHAAVWPSVERMLTACHIRNFTIFVRGGLLLGYYEYTGTDQAADDARMAADPDTQAWWALTGPCQESFTDVADGATWSLLTEVWHLD
jgi:L-rhamnose mutarotase